MSTSIRRIAPLAAAIATIAVAAPPASADALSALLHDVAGQVKTGLNKQLRSTSARATSVQCVNTGAHSVVCLATIRRGRSTIRATVKVSIGSDGRFIWRVGKVG